MQDQQLTIPWEGAAGTAQAMAWIYAELERQGLEAAAPITQPHLYPWSTVLRVPTTAGDLYFKAMGPHLRHEAALTRLLTRRRPDSTLPLLAVDVERGWMLMPDGGTRLREPVRATHDADLWLPVLSIYGEMQLGVAEHVGELLGLGVPDRRLATLPDQYAALLEDQEMLRIDREPGVSAAEYRRLRDLAPRIEELASELASYGVMETLNHGDLHDGNVFVGDGGPRIFDWGDAHISHPFFSLRTVYVSVEISLDLEERAGELPELRDAYLEPWARHHTREQLVAAFDLAQRLAPLNGALGWYAEVSHMDETWREKYAHPVPVLLQDLLWRMGEA